MNLTFMTKKSDVYDNNSLALSRQKYTNDLNNFSEIFLQ